VGGIILAFALYNIHSISNVTEGGVLGLTLLLEKMLSVSPACTGFILNVLFYCLGFKTFGKDFLVYSAFSITSFSLFYKLFEQFDRVYPQIANKPLLAAILGALLVGLGVGLCVRAGGAPTGDDAMAMSLSHITKVGIEWIYLFGDILVIGLSLLYIPFSKIIFSLITVLVSGQVVALLQSPSNYVKRFKRKKQGC
jgi:uncharacterized membrane-anchored protein YitT (DUF2179 family)